MDKKTIRDVDLKNKRVLVRVDFNVPVDNGTVTDTTRVRAAIPTLQYILEQQPRAVILMSHLGRPKGAPDPEFTLAPVAPELAKLLGADVQFASDCVGTVAEQAIAALPQGGVILLENTRFYAGETKNDADLAAQMAKLGDIHVDDAFGTAHRAHASNVGVADHLVSVAGFLMEKEIDYLATTLENPKRPFIAILGGAKVSDKIKVIEALLGKVDYLLIGGGMANTFFMARGYTMGNSLVENEAAETARELLAKSNGKIILPTDAIIGDKFDDDAQTQVISVSDGVPDGWSVYDIGPNTLTNFRQQLDDAQTIVWNGPMGVFEMPNFAKGTFAVARMLAERAGQGATTIIGGGDSAAAIESSGLSDQITHISTGGGASLELLEGRTLPGLTALADR